MHGSNEQLTRIVISQSVRGRGPHKNTIAVCLINHYLRSRRLHRHRASADSTFAVETSETLMILSIICKDSALVSAGFVMQGFFPL